MVAKQGESPVVVVVDTEQVGRFKFDQLFTANGDNFKVGGLCVFFNFGVGTTIFGCICAPFDSAFGRLWCCLFVVTGHHETCVAAAAGPLSVLLGCSNETINVVGTHRVVARPSVGAWPQGVSVLFRSHREVIRNRTTGEGGRGVTAREGFGALFAEVGNDVCDFLARQVFGCRASCFCNAARFGFRQLNAVATG